MTDREQVIATLRAHKAEFHLCGEARLYLFGSVARREARADSDVMTRASLHPLLRLQIEAEALQDF